MGEYAENRPGRGFKFFTFQKLPKFFIVFTSVVTFNIEFKIADKTTKLEVH